LSASDWHVSFLRSYDLMSDFLNAIRMGSRPGLLTFAPLFLRRASAVLVE
jgi:hypothetical protein